MNQARLLLDDGTTFAGVGFGAERPVAGEVVFNTGMTGYVETLTDPSYRGQILVLTYPLVGNYGVPAPRPAGSLATALRIGPHPGPGRWWCSTMSPTTATMQRRARCATGSPSEGVPAITGIDTRTLTRRLRERGTMQGWLVPQRSSVDDAKATAHAVEMRAEVFRRVAPGDTVIHGDGELTVLLVDVGAKDNLVRSLLERGVRVVRAPWHADLAPLARQAHGVLIGNGPGDPKDLGALVAQVRALLADGGRPVFGVCLGNQILALAAGGDTYKLPYGHRGVNQPVQDLLTPTLLHHQPEPRLRGARRVAAARLGAVVRQHRTTAPTRASARGCKPVLQRAVPPRGASRARRTPRFLFDDFLRVAGAMRQR